MKTNKAIEGTLRDPLTGELLTTGSVQLVSNGGWVGAQIGIARKFPRTIYAAGLTEGGYNIDLQTGIATPIAA